MRAIPPGACVEIAKMPAGVERLKITKRRIGDTDGWEWVARDSGGDAGDDIADREGPDDKGVGEYGEQGTETTEEGGENGEQGAENGEAGGENGSGNVNSGAMLESLKALIEQIERRTNGCSTRSSPTRGTSITTRGESSRASLDARGRGLVFLQVAGLGGDGSLAKRNEIAPPLAPCALHGSETLDPSPSVRAGRVAMAIAAEQVMQGLAGVMGPLVQAMQANQAIMTEVLNSMSGRGGGEAQIRRMGMCHTCGCRAVTFKGDARENMEWKAKLPAYPSNVHGDSGAVIRWAQVQYIGVAETAVELEYGEEASEVLEFSFRLESELIGCCLESPLVTRNGVDDGDGLEAMRQMMKVISSSLVQGPLQRHQ